MSSKPKLDGGETNVSQEYCQGCGAKIQSTEANQFGYVPEHLIKQDSILCQRCFRINHYGRDEVGPVTASDSLESIRAGVEWSTGVCLVVDLLDFEAGLPAELLGLVRGRDLIIALNKADLIPDQTPLREVENWAKRRLDYYGLPKVKAVVVSAANGYGFPVLADSLERLGQNVLFVGITNVGKSSVLQRLLQMRIGGGKGTKIKPTISPYPGTTVSVSRWHCPGGLILADSPGYVPKGRISDLVSPEVSVQIIPHQSLTSHLYPAREGDIVYIKGLGAVEVVSRSGEGLLIGFTGSGVRWQRSSIKHLDKWLEKGDQQAQIKVWEEHAFALNPGEDLIISGLGWVSARKAKYKLSVHVPTGTQVTTRQNLIGSKNKK